MYFNGSLSVDPSQETKINKVKPTKAFARVLHFMTAGLVSEKEEQETFTAMSILQQINGVLRSCGVDNIVRLMKDDLDIYLDTEGKENDLKDALDSFLLEYDEMGSELFQKLLLVAEHEDDTFRYLIEINVRRVHKVGEYPVDIKLTGVFKQFSEGEKEKLKEVFSNQNSYDGFLKEKKLSFQSFQDNLEQGIRKFITSDNIKSDFKSKIVRPSKKVSSKSGIKNNSGHTGVHYGYHGWNDHYYYCYYWGDMCHSNHIYVHDTVIIDDHGNDVMDIGESGFDAGEFNTLNSEADIEPPGDGDVSYYSDNEFSSDLPGPNYSSSGPDECTDDSSFFDSCSSDDSSSSSCSSCSNCGSCSSCGGD